MDDPRDDATTSEGWQPSDPLAKGPDDDRTPRWVVAFGVVMLVFLAAFVILHLAGRGFHEHGGM